jgi:hypothetical protein
LEKACRDCERVLPLVEFHVWKLARDGRASYCRPCSSVRDQRRRAARRAELDAIKLARGCTDCGYNVHPAALQFDHLPGTEKRFDIGKSGIGVSRAKRDAEIAKCEVVCANCHAIRTAERRVVVE